MDFIPYLDEVLVILILAFVTVAVPVVFAQLFIWLRAKAEVLRAGVNENILFVLDQVVLMAVSAVEKMAENGGIEDKKEEAIAIIKNALTELGLKSLAANVDLIAAKIEEAIQQGWENSFAGPEE
jgi:hypothetical protein